MRYFCFLLLLTAATAPAQSWQMLPSLPEPVTNNAVAQARVADSIFVYTFTGLDQSKIWSGIHLKAWRLRLGDTAWQTLPPVPDPNGGKIAAWASTVKEKIYLIGGYHVAANGNETSSKKVHRFDPVLNTWLPDGADIPVAIDDQVQAVWNDSLIFVVTGWSNTTNVANVQIYNPATDSWAAGTPVPNLSNYKVFGGSGTIIGDTLYYAGGARTGSNFPATTFFRKGYIHPDDPTQIDWSGATENLARGYRMACVNLLGQAVWLGGSEVTYNYNGIAYNGSGGVPALDRIALYRPTSGQIEPVFGAMPALMDLRGAGQVSPGQVVLAGGMGPGQQPSDQVWLIDLLPIVPTLTPPAKQDFHIFPNPAIGDFTLQTGIWVQVDLFDFFGKKRHSETGLGALRFDVSHLPNGIYFLKINGGHGAVAVKKIIVGQ